MVRSRHARSTLAVRSRYICGEGTWPRGGNAYRASPTSLRMRSRYICGAVEVHLQCGRGSFAVRSRFGGGCG